LADFVPEDIRHVEGKADAKHRPVGPQSSHHATICGNDKSRTGVHHYVAGAVAIVGHTNSHRKL
jgi:hypothetical protein